MNELVKKNPELPYNYSEAEVLYGLRDEYDQPIGEILIEAIMKAEVVFIMGKPSGGKSTLLSQISAEIYRKSNGEKTIRVFRFDTYYKNMQEKYGQDARTWTPEVWQELSTEIAKDVLEQKTLDQQTGINSLILVEVPGVGAKDRGRTAAEIVGAELYDNDHPQKVLSIALAADPETEKFGAEVRKEMAAVYPDDEHYSQVKRKLRALGIDVGEAFGDDPESGKALKKMYLEMAPEEKIEMIKNEVAAIANDLVDEQVYFEKKYNRWRWGIKHSQGSQYNYEAFNNLQIQHREMFYLGELINLIGYNKRNVNAFVCRNPFRRPTPENPIHAMHQRDSSPSTK